ncbi:MULTISPECIES: MFS transporter [Streptomyces]|uniref:DHA1 family inner membrane transport protein n=1 Tax=Streptomyces nymphaeiformis TaxID=2663842 RepID=A0A7W7TX46_9ACTN|nr:MFS transporter [Streptomyces nymphaeiformis]MBB4980995.1 DHA1 family inner membrane transport protein [Streptomyces nymphaeiformis]
MPLPLLALMLGVFCVGTAEIAIAGILPEMSADLGVSVPTVGLLVTGYALGVTIGGPIITLLTAKWSRKGLLLGLMGIFIVGNVVAALAPNYGMLMGARIFTSFSHGTFAAVAWHVAALMSPPDKQATAMAKIALGFNFANVLGSPIGTLIGQQFGWRSTFVFITVFAVACVALIYAFVPSGLSTTDDEDTEKDVSLRDQLKVFRSGSLQLSMLITVLAQGAVFTTSTYLAPLLRDVSHFAPAMVGILLIVFGIGSVLGNILGGRAADTNVMRGVLTAQTALLASLVLFWALSPYKIPAAAALFLFGAAGFSIIPALQARILSVAAAAPALALSANVSAFNLGNGLGAWLGGTTIDLGLGVRDVTLTAALATTTALLLSLAMWARTRRPDTELPTLDTTPSATDTPVHQKTP